MWSCLLHDLGPVRLLRNHSRKNFWPESLVNLYKFSLAGLIPGDILPKLNEPFKLKSNIFFWKLSRRWTAFHLHHRSHQWTATGTAGEGVGWLRSVNVDARCGRSRLIFAHDEYKGTVIFVIWKSKPTGKYRRAVERVRTKPDVDGIIWLFRNRDRDRDW